MKILIHSQDEGSGEERTYLGLFSPPWHVQRDQTLREHEGAGVQEYVERLWSEWREINPEPNSDDEFTTWLVEKKEWTKCEDELFDVTVEW